MGEPLEQGLVTKISSPIMLHRRPRKPARSFSMLLSCSLQDFLLCWRVDWGGTTGAEIIAFGSTTPGKILVSSVLSPCLYQHSTAEPCGLGWGDYFQPTRNDTVPGRNGPPDWKVGLQFFSAHGLVSLSPAGQPASQTRFLFWLVAFANKPLWPLGLARELGRILQLYQYHLQLQSHCIACSAVPSYQLDQLTLQVACVHHAISFTASTWPSAHALLSIYNSTTPSVPNYKPFQESWRVKSSQSLTKIIERNIKIYDIK